MPVVRHHEADAGILKNYQEGPLPASGSRTYSSNHQKDISGKFGGYLIAETDLEIADNQKQNQRVARTSLHD